MITFKELSIFYTFVIIYYLLDSFLILMLYLTQDSMTSHQVFLIYHSSCIFFDGICVIILPTHVLIKTLTELPEIWTNFTPVQYNFYMSGVIVSPRREGAASSRAGTEDGAEGGAEGGAEDGAESGAGGFRFVLRGEQRSGGKGGKVRGGGAELGHSQIQIEMPDVVC